MSSRGLAAVLGLVLFSNLQICAAEVEAGSAPETAVVFAGGMRRIPAVIRNTTAGDKRIELRFRLYQASSATLIPLGEARTWRTLALPAGQCILEGVEIELPDVRAETLFQVVWLDGDRKLGTTPVRAFPLDLLKPIATLVGDTPVALVDPGQLLLPGFGGLPFTKIDGPEDLAGYEGSLLIVAPMRADESNAGWTASVKEKIESGCAAVWIQPLADAGTDSFPVAYVLNRGRGMTVVAPASVVSDFEHSPLAQASLVALAELAAGKRLPGLPTEPRR